MNSFACHPVRRSDSRQFGLGGSSVTVESFMDGAGASFAELSQTDMYGAQKRIRVAIVAPSMGILGGQAVQADRLIRAWSDDPEISAWLVPINPVPRGPLRRAIDVKY